MNKQDIFNKDISLYWHGEVRDQYAILDLQRSLADKRHSLTLSEFKELLGNHIIYKTYSPEMYEGLTGLDFEIRDEVSNDLMKLWRLMFGDEELLRPAGRD